MRDNNPTPKESSVWLEVGESTFQEAVSDTPSGEYNGWEHDAVDAQEQVEESLCPKTLVTKPPKPVTPKRVTPEPISFRQDWSDELENWRSNLLEMSSNASHENLKPPQVSQPRLFETILNPTPTQIPVIKRRKGTTPHKKTLTWMRENESPAAKLSRSNSVETPMVNIPQLFKTLGSSSHMELPYVLERQTQSNVERSPPEYQAGHPADDEADTIIYYPPLVWSLLYILFVTVVVCVVMLLTLEI